VVKTATPQFPSRGVARFAAVPGGMQNHLVAAPEPLEETAGARSVGFALTGSAAQGFAAAGFGAGWLAAAFSSGGFRKGSIPPPRAL
jgi:hypothetical protein